MVTAPYIGRAEGTLWSRLEALGISTDFMAGVLTARKLEGGIRFGLGSTLATTKTALAAIGGFRRWRECLADDYEMGVRIARRGLSRRTGERGRRDNRSGLHAARLLRAPDALGAVHPRFAPRGLPGSA